MKTQQPLFFIHSVLSFLFAVFALQHFTTAYALGNTNYLGNETDHKALLAIIDDHPDGVLSSWNHSLHCFWEGVTCGPKHNRVVVLNLNQSGLAGTISPFIGNLSFLRYIALYNNRLNGQIPIEIGRLFRLRRLKLSNNTLNGGIPANISGCINLRVLSVGFNNLTGKLPIELKALSNLQILFLKSNNLFGTIPPSIFNLSSLRILSLRSNKFTGTIPQELGKLQKLERLILKSNRLTGEIPHSFGNLSRLSWLNLNDNKLQGRIPPSLGNCANLLYLNLSSNKFYGYLPNELFVKTTQLITLDFSHNYLQGSLPMEVSTLMNLQLLFVYNNNFSGEIPSVFSSLTELQYLNMANNIFHGPIPSSFVSLKSLVYVDLSHNNLCCLIPEYFSTFPLISYLNLSYNNFGGSVPTKGIFANTRAISIVGNTALCGGVPDLHLPLCVEGKGNNRILSHVIKSVILPLFCAFVGVLAMSTCIWLYLKGNIKIKSTLSGAQVKESFLKVSYDMLLKATDGFSSGNLLGSGTFGSVFKGTLDGMMIAVKVLDLQQRGGRKSFMAECEALRSIHHRNLVEIITACSSMDFQRNDFKALVFEYMPNGSLQRWLHEHRNLSLLQRLDIAIDVAHAVNYLHHECGSLIVHCDLKPSNILLDHEMVAHVADFGLAKVLDQPLHPNESSSIGVRGTFGYAAPDNELHSFTKRSCLK